MTLKFDLGNIAEVTRAERVITDMLRNGYALVAKGEDGKFHRVKKFDGATGEYVIVDFDPTTGERQRIKHDKAEATAIAPTAGG